MTVTPTIGSRTPQQIEDAIGAVAIELSAEEVAALETAVPAAAAAGERDLAPMMATLDGER